MTIKEIVSNAIASTSFGDYVDKVLNNSFQYTNELINELESAIKDKDDIQLEYLLAIAAYDGVDRRFTNILTNLLPEDWHHSREDIVMLLEDIKDPSAVSILYNTAVNIPEWDEGRGLARKCIWALGAIGTIDAKEKLILLKNMNDFIINEVAALELTRF